MRQLFLSLLILCVAYCLYAQNDSYEYVTFEDFLKTKVTTDSAFVYTFYKNMAYPKVATKYWVEEKVEVLLIYRGERPPNSETENNALGREAYLELIPQSNHLCFIENIKKVEEELYETIKDKEASVMTRFYIWFHLDGLIGMDKKNLYLYNNNTIVITGYTPPSYNTYKF